MKITIEPDLKSKTFCTIKSYALPREKNNSIVSFKSYQKLFVLIISFLIFLIFPQSPKVLGNICESYNSRAICNVW